jgi:DNA replication ATP-dependent helicase Dna2
MDASTSPDVLYTTAEHRCFMCRYGDQPCTEPSIEGTLRGAVERWRDTPHPVLVLRQEIGDDVAVVLRPSDATLVRALVRLGAREQARLRVGAMHLHRGEAGPEAVDRTARKTLRTLRTSPASLVVLEPDLLLNITDINHAEYCVRQYTLHRLVPSAPTAASIRGTVLHGAFKEMLKGQGESPDALLTQALRAQTGTLALRQLDAAEIAAEATPHLQALANWHAHQREQLWANTPHVRVETFVLAPDIGLKGRLDAVWQDEYTSQLLELKTSTVRGDLPRREHRWQVHGYQALLTARSTRVGERRPAATLLYSGTPGQAEAHTLPFTLRDLQRVVELRNFLAISHATGSAPPPPGARKCARCAVRTDCLRASPLLGWEPPPSDEPRPAEDPRDAAWFGRYYRLLAHERRTAEEQGQMLWRLTATERCALGFAIANLRLEGEPVSTEQGEWQYHFACDNVSELRENDAIILSDGDPIHGAAVTGTVLRATNRSIAVWVPEPIEHPALIDRYGSDIVHDRTVRNLWRWLDVSPRVRALVRGDAEPRFAPRAPAGGGALNPEQRDAIGLALAAQDYALIQGPPGTGKTHVIAELVRLLVERGDRVLLAGFTNQAVDNMLLRLLERGFTRFRRLGHQLSIAPSVRPFRLGAHTGAEASAVAAADPVAWRTDLLRAPVVASTTATWSSEQYDDAGDALAFDVAIVDEASQLTVPALCGALRFATRFVLVGDDRQLPPLVVSQVAAEGGLNESLFTQLAARWGDQASVGLTRQYRMHPEICAFPSRTFYGGALMTDGAARDARLMLEPAAPSIWDAALDPARPLVLVDVPPWSNGTTGDASNPKSSARQADVVRALAQALCARGVPQANVGVIAPYRAHVAAVRQRLASAGLPDVLVDTVDRFQGGERQVMVLAFGLDQLPSEGSRGTEFLGDPHRLNVALTRAQSKLLLVGNWESLKTIPLLRALLDYCGRLYGSVGGVVRVGVPVR